MVVLHKLFKKKSKTYNFKEVAYEIGYFLLWTYFSVTGRSTEAVSN